MFEGFFDFLAFVTEHRDIKLQQGFIILNSVNGQNQAIEKINAHLPNTVLFYLDNDLAGKTAFENMRRNLNIQIVEDHSSSYSGFKDYSEYWQNRCTQTQK